ncbi:MAG: saccharopine dehydrogenase NADP-binding domain-containing protein, partial [Promethearchaeota archaeon]
MKILALGGAGDMGRYTVSVLLESPKVTSITVADKNYECAKVFVELVQEKLKQPEMLTAIKSDVTNHENLVDLMESHDLIVNTVGPFFRFEKMIIEAAIE